MAYKTLQVSIVGGGIGGLTTAIALRKSGHRVKVYEKTSAFRETGQGISIAPNGGLVLKALDFDFRRARMIDFLDVALQRADTLENIVPPFRRDWAAEVGLASMCAYRPDLHSTLLELATEKEADGVPVEIIMGTGVTSYDCENATITLASGEAVHSDVVIAADGLHSKAPAHILGPGCPEIAYTGHVILRFTMLGSRIQEDPETAVLLSGGRSASSFYMSPDGKRHVIRYWCREDGLQNFTVYMKRNDEEVATLQRKYKVDRDSLVGEMEGFHPALKKVGSMADEVLPLWLTMSREPLQRVSKGRMAVIGDAAHPVLPRLAQGAISAIEDAGALMVLLSDIPDNTDYLDIVRQRLDLFSKMRIPRLAAQKHYSDAEAMANAAEQKRDVMSKFLTPEEMPTNNSEVHTFLAKYDVIEDAKQVLEESLASEVQE